MQPIIQIKARAWPKIAAIVLLLALAATTVGFDQRSHGHVGILTWAIAGVLLLACGIPLNALKGAKARLLAFDGDSILWRLGNGEMASEQRVRLGEIHTLKWIVPVVGERQGQDYRKVRLVFVTANGTDRPLPAEFLVSAYRGRIEAAFVERIPNLRIAEEYEGTGIP